MTRGLHYIFTIDACIIYVSSFIWCILATWELNRAGRTTVSLSWASLAAVVGHVALGPGAYLSAFWYGREKRMMGRASLKVQ